jgi:tetratricopeptide (TPR) repeat protein
MPRRLIVKIVLTLVASLAALSQTGCSSFSRSSGSNVQDSVLHNLNPAPQALTPPDYSQDAASPVVDNVHLSSQADYHFTMGETLSYAGQSTRAVEEFKLVLIYDPNSVHVRLRLAAEYVRLGMVTEAVEQSESAVEMAPDNVEARMMLGGLYSGLKMYEPAKDQFAEILKREPAHPEASIYLGALYAEQRKYQQAIEYFQTLAKNPKFEDTEKAYYYIGRIRGEQGKEHFDEAIKAYTKALELKPEYPEAALQMATVLKAQGHDEQMVKVLKSYQDKFGPEREMSRLLSQYYLDKEDFDHALENLEVLDSFERDNLNIKVQIALILIEQKSYEAAAGRLEDILHQAPDSDKVRYYLGAVYEELKRGDLALLHYRKISVASNYYPEAVVHSAHILKETNRLDGAVALLEKALKEQEDVPQLYAYYATLLDDQKSYKKAIGMLGKAVDKFPTNTQLIFFLGTMHDRVGQTQETIAQMQRVLELDKEHVQALNYLAYTYAEMGSNLEEAEQLSRRALALQPNDGYILDTLGWILFKRGDNEAAIRYLEAAFKARPDEAIISEHLGDAYLRHQMWQRAVTMYRRAIDVEKDQVKTKKIAEKLANVESQSERGTRAPASIPSAKAQ